LVIRRHRGYVAFATASLALAVGAPLVVFTIVNALWLRPSPFPEPDRLVVLMDDSTGAEESATFGKVEAAERWSAFEAVAGQVATSGAFAALKPRVRLEQVGTEVETLGVTSQYFRLLGQQIRGRDFTRDDNRDGAEPVAIISDGLWARAFDGRADLIGAVAAASPFPIRIIGVAPPGFEGARRGERADVWIPANLVPRVAPAGEIPEDAVPTLVLARLRTGQTAVEAKRRLVRDAVNERDRQAKERVQLVPLAHVFGTVDARTIVIAEGRAGRVVAALAGLVLLAGCTTLMALVLVHYEQRRRELCVRLALGASRGRLIADLARELAWPAAGGAVGAVLVAVWSLGALPSLSLPGGVDLRRLDLSIDWRVLSVALATAALTLFVAALVPVSRFTRSRLAGELIGSSATPPASSHRLRQLLLAVHVSATIIVLVAAGLFVRAVLYGFSAGAGFDVDRTVFMQVQLAPPFVSSETNMDARDAIIEARRRRLEDGLRSLPGVELVARGRAPIGPGPATLLLTPRTIETRGERRDLLIGAMSGSPDLLHALGVPLRQGRALMPADAATRPQPVLVTASLARTLWPEDDPVGQVLSRPGRSFRPSVSTVVGLVEDFAYGSLTQASAGVLISVSPFDGGGIPEFVVRTARPDLIVAPIQRLVREVVPDAPRLVVSTGRQIVADDLGRQRLGAWFFSGFGLVALLLGAGGVFGLVAYLVESRRREFGVRLAIGATPGHLVRCGLAAGLTPVAIGTAAGVLVAALVARVFVTLLPGLSTLDPITYVSVSLLMIGGTAVAGFAAAWRLRRIGPAEALRAE
jgi:predicted permease